MMPLAQVAAGGYSLGQLAIFVVVILAIAGLVMVAVRAFGISVPGWLIQVISIVVAAIIIIAAIKIVMSM